jgi:PAS domain S-box
MAKNSITSYVSKGGFFKAVVEDGSDLIFIVDYKGTILYNNNSVVETLGYGTKSLIGKNFFDYIKPDTLAEFRKSYLQSTKKRYNESVEFQFLCKDKSFKYLEFNSINLKQKEKIDGLILDCRDITQRKKDAEELLRAQKTKELFLANISHEIRTPINGIAGMATLLSQNPNSKDQVTYLNAISSAADNLKVIINDILDLASIESGKLKFEEIGFNLTDLVNSMMDSFRVQASEKNLKLGYTLERGMNVILMGDPVRLNQILINLISNAIKFTNEGEIKVNFSSDKEKAGRLVLRFDVVDTGIGVPKEKLKKIFESFSQADASVTRKYGGTGLGLTIVKQLVKLQNGTIKVQSEEGKGSTFSVAIPYKIGNPENIIQVSSLKRKGNDFVNSLSKVNLLLVEDNDINRLYASNILKGWGCHFQIAENGFVAIEKVKGNNFDLILMDIQMPVMDGFETTKAIRAMSNLKSKVPIIALTANATNRDIEKCLSAGMNDYVAKPFTPDDLYKTMVKYVKTDSVKQKVSAPVVTPPNENKFDLSYLKTVSNNNMEFIKEMIETFQVSIPKNIQEIKTNLANKDWENLSRAFHKIKPSLALMGLVSLKDIAQELEQKSKQKIEVRKLTAPTTEFCNSVSGVLEELRSVQP